MIIKSYDEHGNVREPVVEPVPPVILEPPEGDWMCVDCGTVKDRTLMATWIPDLFSTEGLPTGRCEECAGNEQAQFPSSKDEGSFPELPVAEKIINY